jgi:serine/threonine-protein kinase
MAVPFDADRLELTGPAVPVLEGIRVETNGVAQYSVSATGTLAYLSGRGTAAQRRLVWVTRNGVEQPLTAPALAYGYPRLSPDGRRVAVELDSQIWLYDLVRDTLTRFTFQGPSNQSPGWTPDGTRIAFRSGAEGPPPNLFWQLADGSGGLERLTKAAYTQNLTAWSAKGDLLAFFENNPKTLRDIWVLRLSDRQVEPHAKSNSPTTRRE